MTVVRTRCTKQVERVNWSDGEIAVYSTVVVVPFKNINTTHKSPSLLGAMFLVLDLCFVLRMSSQVCTTQVYTKVRQLQCGALSNYHDTACDRRCHQRLRRSSIPSCPPWTRSRDPQTRAKEPGGHRKQRHQSRLALAEPSLVF